MHTFISLSSPHLGYLYNSSSLIDAGIAILCHFIHQILLKKKSGIWILKRWRKSLSLQQLSMTDTKEIEDTYLYKLSRAPVFFQYYNFLKLY